MSTDSKQISKEISEQAEKRVKELQAKYPDARSAIMPALYIAQEELGYLNKEAIHWVSDMIGISPAHVMEVATFYTMYYKNPVGKFHFQVCRTLSCALRGAGCLTKHLKEKFDLEPHEVSKDGRWSFEEVECLGSCGSAPMVEVNDRYFENLTPEKLDELIAAIEKSEPDLRYSAKENRLGDGLGSYPKSEIL